MTHYRSLTLSTTSPSYLHGPPPTPQIYFNAFNSTSVLACFLTLAFYRYARKRSAEVFGGWTPFDLPGPVPFFLLFLGLSKKSGSSSPLFDFCFAIKSNYNHADRVRGLCSGGKFARKTWIWLLLTFFSPFLLLKSQTYQSLHHYRFSTLYHWLEATK